MEQSLTDRQAGFLMARMWLIGYCVPYLELWWGEKRWVHGVTVEELQDSLQAGRAWSLPDGRVWMRERRSDEA